MNEKFSWRHSRRFYQIGILVGVLVLAGAFAWQNTDVFRQEAHIVSSADLSSANGLTVEKVRPISSSAQGSGGTAGVPASEENEQAAQSELSEQEAEPQAVLASPSSKLLMPVEGEIIRAYGMSYDEAYGDYRHHRGVDIAAEAGAPVFAAAGGIVKEVGADELWGDYIIIDHGKGLVGAYYGVISEDWQVGDQPDGGDVIGKVSGNIPVEAGPSHLCFCLTMRDEQVDPQDYM